jgi:hypothetical protein
MLNPKEYRFIRTEILSYKELVKWENSKYPDSRIKQEAHSDESSVYFSEQIKKYQEDGFIVEVINMSTNTNMSTEVSYSDFGVWFIHTAHLMLYMPI